MTLGLDALEIRVREDLAKLDLPKKEWSIPKSVGGKKVFDAVIVGAGQSGLALAAALILNGLKNIVVFDRAPEGFEGPWATFARMPTLRTAKNATGPALGIPSLTYRAWYEAQNPPEAWEDMTRAPRSSWMDYLRWFRRVMDLPIRNDSDVEDIDLLSPDIVRLQVRSPKGLETVYARHVALATGFDGFGGPQIPAFIEGADRDRWAHTSDPIDFSRIEGKQVGIVGIGASAIDNGIAALKAGAESVTFFVRRESVPIIQKFHAIRGVGRDHGWSKLPDDWKWRLLAYEVKTQNPAPRHTFMELMAHRNFRVLTGCAVESVTDKGAGLAVDTRRGRYEVDFLILGTGFSNDIHRRPELKSLASDILLWRDVHPDAEHADLAAAPYLGEGFSLQEKTAGCRPGIDRIKCLAYSGTLTWGKLPAAVPYLTETAMKTLEGIAAHLFADDMEQHYAALVGYLTPELTEEEVRALTSG